MDERQKSSQPNNLNADPVKKQGGKDYLSGPKKAVRVLALAVLVASGCAPPAPNTNSTPIPALITPTPSFEGTPTPGGGVDVKLGNNEATNLNQPHITTSIEPYLLSPNNLPADTEKSPFIKGLSYALATKIEGEQPNKSHDANYLHLTKQNNDGTTTDIEAVMAEVGDGPAADTKIYYIAYKSKDGKEAVLAPAILNTTEQIKDEKTGTVLAATTLRFLRPDGSPGQLLVGFVANRDGTTDIEIADPNKPGVQIILTTKQPSADLAQLIKNLFVGTTYAAEAYLPIPVTTPTPPEATATPPATATPKPTAQATAEPTKEVVNFATSIESQDPRWQRKESDWFKDPVNGPKQLEIATRWALAQAAAVSHSELGLTKEQIYQLLVTGQAGQELQFDFYYPMTANGTSAPPMKIDPRKGIRFVFVDAIDLKDPRSIGMITEQYYLMTVNQDRTLVIEIDNGYLLDQPALSNNIAFVYALFCVANRSRPVGNFTRPEYLSSFAPEVSHALGITFNPNLTPIQNWEGAAQTSIIK